MRRIVFALVLNILFLSLAVAQVGVNADNSPPDPSAGLDIRFTDRGFLPPRLTRAEMLAIQSPAEGLMVFCTDCGAGQQGAICLYQNGDWMVTISECIPPLAPGPATFTVQATSVVWNWNTVSWAQGYKWNTINDYGSAIDMGTSTSKTEGGLNCNTSYTRFIWAYNDCGHSAAATLAATTTSMAPASPGSAAHSATSSQVTWNWTMVPEATGYKWNTVNNLATAIDNGMSLSHTENGLNCNELQTSFVWAYNACGTSPATTLQMTTLSNPPAPTAGIHSAGQTWIIWNWNTVTGATGYKWSATNNYNTASNLGNVTSYNEGGLSCNQTVTRFIWAVNSCGYSLVTVLTFSTAPCGPSCPTTVTDPRNSEVYGVVAIGTHCWMSRNMNVGVKIPGVMDQQNNGIIEKYCYNDDDMMCNIYGGLYQWAEAVQYVNGATNNSSWNPPPVGNVQGICPAGWHIPSTAEWDILSSYLGGAAVAGGKLKETGYDHWSAPNTDATNLSGFTGLPGGLRHPAGGFAELTFSGYFWTSTGMVTTAYARQLLFNTGAINTLMPEKVFGLSVRCVMN